MNPPLIRIIRGMVDQLETMTLDPNDDDSEKIVNLLKGANGLLEQLDSKNTEIDQVSVVLDLLVPGNVPYHVMIVRPPQIAIASRPHDWEQVHRERARELNKENRLKPIEGS
jgi:hypothetical protein